MNVSKTIFLLTTLCLLFFNPAAAQPQSQDNNQDHFESGRRLQRQGDWESALNLWLAARDTLSTDGRVDPRIGFAFIELATEKKATQFYDAASALYFWGLSGTNMGEFKEAIGQEIARLSPLLDEREHSAWLKLLDADDPDVFTEIKGFWRRKDPIPTTILNERLVEHWQRIALAREKLKADSTTVYGTDDRGLLLVKYGPPDLLYTGKLGMDQLEIMRWLSTDFRIRQEIQRYNTTPDYEIWLYAGLRDNEGVHFLFGKKAGYGQYGLLSSIEDFIPERAFRRTSAKTTGGIIPGFMLQLMYYRELIEINTFYLERFRELEVIWSNARAGGQFSPNYHNLRGLLSHYRSIDNDNKNLKYLPKDRTNTLESLQLLDLHRQNFRYLADGTTPMLMIIATSNARTFTDDHSIIYFKKTIKSKLKTRYFLIEYDKNWNEINREEDLPGLRGNETAVLHSPQTDDKHYILVAEELRLDSRKAEITAADIPDTVKVISIGKQAFDAFPVLSSDTTSLEASDLLVGRTTPTYMDTSSTYMLPVIPQDLFDRSDSLHVYFEVYHLSLPHQTKGRGSYRVDCAIKEIDGQDVKKKAILTESLNFGEAHRNSSKTFQLDLSKLEHGEYQLELTFTDLNSSQSVGRRARFAVTKTE